MGREKTCPKCGGEMEEGRIYPGKLKIPVQLGSAPKKKGVFTYNPKDKKRSNRLCM